VLCTHYSYCCLSDRRLIQAKDHIDYGKKMYPLNKYFIYLFAEYSYLNKELNNAKISFEEAFKSNAVTRDETKKDELFNVIKGENKEIKQLWKDYCK
jgi:hypothetical protein